MATLAEYLDHFARTQPDAPFVIAAESGETLTYHDFARAVRGLRAALGEPPRTIAIALPGGIPAAVVWLAALTGGHRLVPCSPDATADERSRLARQTHPDVLVVADAEAARGFASPFARVFTAGGLMDAVRDWATRPAGPGEDARAPLAARQGELRLSTSGTSGEPKGMLLSARQIAWTAEHVRDSHHLDTSDRGLCVLPFFHVNAPIVSLCTTLTAGAAVVIAPRFSRREFWRLAARERITWASIVPTIVALLLQAPEPAQVCPTLRFARTASAPLPVAHHAAFERRFGVPLVETYGLSEAASTVAANPVPPGERKAGSVGLPVGVELRICEPRSADELPASRALRDVAPGAEGEICVRGPSVISGYAGGARADAFAGGWFRTGDLGWRDGDGYLYITGRIGDIINRGGEKIAPREIEEVLLAHPAVREAVVAGEPDALYGQRIVAFVVARAARSEGLSARLRAYCATRLTAYKVPEVVRFVEALPRTRTGKVARRELSGIAAGS